MAQSKCVTGSGGRVGHLCGLADGRQMPLLFFATKFGQHVCPGFFLLRDVLEYELFEFFSESTGPVKLSKEVVVFHLVLTIHLSYNQPGICSTSQALGSHVACEL